jgi:L-alanine-DL-glutamate epimerase-like enolase superfamily enzyme
LYIPLWPILRGHQVRESAIAVAGVALGEERPVVETRGGAHHPRPGLLDLREALGDVLVRLDEREGGDRARVDHRVLRPAVRVQREPRVVERTAALLLPDPAMHLARTELLQRHRVAERLRGRLHTEPGLGIPHLEHLPVPSTHSDPEPLRVRIPQRRDVLRDLTGPLVLQLVVDPFDPTRERAELVRRHRKLPLQRPYYARVVGPQPRLLELLEEPPLPDHVGAVGVERTEQFVDFGHGRQPYGGCFRGGHPLLRPGQTYPCRTSVALVRSLVMDRIRHVQLSSVVLPLEQPISDAKVLTGRQRPMTEVVFLFARIATEQDQHGIGFSYSKRAGGPAQYAHAKEIAANLIGEDPSDIGKVYDKLLWAGASVGRSGVATQAIAGIDIALWDLKAKRANLPLAKLLGAHRDSVRAYNTSGGFLHAPIEEVKERASKSLADGIGGIKIKVGQPDTRIDLERVRAVREHLGDDVPLMVDANQQWDRPTALRIGRVLEQFGLVWIEEPLDAYDALGHAELAAALDTPIATGEMLSSVGEHVRLIEARAADIVQPDAPRIGGITPFLKLATLADHNGLQLAPHFAMEIHLHLAAAYPREPWVEHFEWLNPLFNERLETVDGRMLVPDRPGLGFTTSEQCDRWTVDSCEFS